MRDRATDLRVTREHEEFKGEIKEGRRKSHLGLALQVNTHAPQERRTANEHLDLAEKGYLNGTQPALAVPVFKLRREIAVAWSVGARKLALIEACATVRMAGRPALMLCPRRHETGGTHCRVPSAFMLLSRRSPTWFALTRTDAYRTRRWTPV